MDVVWTSNLSILVLLAVVASTLCGWMASIRLKRKHSEAWRSLGSPGFFFRDFAVWKRSLRFAYFGEFFALRDAALSFLMLVQTIGNIVFLLTVAAVVFWGMYNAFKNGTVSWPPGNYTDAARYSMLYLGSFAICVLVSMAVRSTVYKRLQRLHPNAYAVLKRTDARTPLLGSQEEPLGETIEAWCLDSSFFYSRQAFCLRDPALALLVCCSLFLDFACLAMLVCIVGYYYLK